MRINVDKYKRNMQEAGYDGPYVTVLGIRPVLQGFFVTGWLLNPEDPSFCSCRAGKIHYHAGHYMFFTSCLIKKSIN